MKKSLLIQFLGENPTFKIVDFLIENKGLEGTKIARATLFKVWPQIEEQEIDALGPIMETISDQKEPALI